MISIIIFSKWPCLNIKVITNLPPAFSMEPPRKLKGFMKFYYPNLFDYQYGCRSSTQISLAQVNLSLLLVANPQLFSSQKRNTYTNTLYSFFLLPLNNHWSNLNYDAMKASNGHKLIKISTKSSSFNIKFATERSFHCPTYFLWSVVR